MTDNEIKKALECCKKDDCDNCPNDFGNCYANLAGYALELINRQKLVIEELTRRHQATLKNLEEAHIDIKEKAAEIAKRAKNCNKCAEKSTKVTLRLQEIIAEQRAEIERLKKALDVVDVMEEQHKYYLEKAKAEAVKEFAERLKTKASDFEFGKAVWVVYIDNLVKEMVGEE